MKKLMMLAIVSACGFAALAEPSVKITNVTLTDAVNGVISYTYTVSGDFEGNDYDLLIDVGADGFSGKKVLTNENVSAGTVTKNFNVKALLGKGYLNVSLFAELKQKLYVQLWEGGPYWAECNVGATKPEESGYYFWWGDTVGYKRNATDDGWVSVKDSANFSFDIENCPTFDKENGSQLRSAGYIDSTGNLVAAHDAATAQLGKPWRMPTSEEMDALVGNCTTTWTTRNGVPGRLVMGKGMYASKSIFLPAAGVGEGDVLYHAGVRGYCWSSTPVLDDAGYGRYFVFFSDGFSRSFNCRYYGCPVRPVRGGDQ